MRWMGMSGSCSQPTQSRTRLRYLGAVSGAAATPPSIYRQLGPTQPALSHYCPPQLRWANNALQCAQLLFISCLVVPNSTLARSIKHARSSHVSKPSRIVHDRAASLVSPQRKHHQPATTNRFMDILEASRSVISQK
jgi:hypothetical protein